MLLKSSRGGFVVVEERKKKTNPKLERRCGLDGMSPQPELGEFNRRELFQPVPEIKTHISFLYTVVNPIMIPCSKRQ